MEYTEKKGEVPKVKPPPSLKMLANKRALEEEGSRILLEDPTKFFIFDERSMDDSLMDAKSQSSSGKYDGPTLGAPIGYRRIGQNEYPLILGRYKKPDVQTEKEKKQEERENRLLTAAGEGKDQAKNIEFLAEDRFLDSLPDVNYDEMEFEDSKEWEKGVDPHTEEGKAILSVQPALRFSEEEYEWTKEQLAIHMEYHERTMMSQIENTQARIRSQREYERSEGGEELNENPLENEVADRVLSMPIEELLALSDLDDAYASSKLSDEEISEAATKIPSLSDAQLKVFLERDRSFIPDAPPDAHVRTL